MATIRLRYSGWICSKLLSLEGTTNRIEGRWQITCKATVNIKYPPRACLLLFSHAGRDIHFEEGLLWVLQESGWISPYQGSWEWTVYSDDYRLLSTIN